MANHYAGCRFIGEDGEPKGRTYTYASETPLSEGEIVYGETGKRLVVTDETAPPYTGEGLKFVTTAPPEKEDAALEGTVECEPVADAAPIAPFEISFSDFDSLVIVEQMPVITQHVYTNIRLNS